MKVYLVGMPSSGKTTLGRQLATLLNESFIDLDHEIEAYEQCTVAEVFEKKGEDHFRQLESQLLKSVTSSNTGFVMSTGGGTPCFFDNMDFINKSGLSIFLHVPIAELVSRVIKHSFDDRPLFKGLGQEGLNEKIAKQMEERLPFYSQSVLTLEGADISLNDIFTHIKKRPR